VKKDYNYIDQEQREHEPVTHFSTK